MKHSELMIRLLPDPNADDIGLDESSRRLRHELLCLHVGDVVQAFASESIAGTKGFPQMIGALFVRFTLQPDGLRGIVFCVQRWVDRQWPSGAELIFQNDHLKVSGQNSGAQELVIDQWIARHASSE
jgi:hypothetical protein